MLLKHFLHIISISQTISSCCYVAAFFSLFINKTILCLTISYNSLISTVYKKCSLFIAQIEKMVKTLIWVSHPQEAWVQAEVNFSFFLCIFVDIFQVISSDRDSVTIKGPRNESIRLPGELSTYDVVIPESIEKIAENLVEMEVFNEGVILHQVRQRYLGGMIYTFVGSILIALNPYQRLDIYGNDLMHLISRDVKSNRSPSPHVFAIGGLALHNMMNDNLDQSVLISGESGAGKTETTKKVLTYFSSMAGSTASRAGITVESQILDSNPLLEAFGNAKTVRNNNSSRFGKYMEVNFDSRYHST